VPLLRQQWDGAGEVWLTESYIQVAKSSKNLKITCTSFIEEQHAAGGASGKAW
jgi:hypothetical protein